jgi:tRNA pseudouridine55 synthase
MEGVVLFNKPKNYTSYQIVEFFKKRTKKKVGHGGTLDPLAEGLLILGIGEYTKELNNFLKESIKTYIAEIILGARSTTYDREGHRTRTEFGAGQGNIELEKIKEVVNSFIGEIEQIPPPFSAVKIKGKPAYLLARKGKKVELKPRKVKIYEIKILEITPNNTNSGTKQHETFVNNNPHKSVLDPYKSVKLKIEVTCSSGTYIRSLANDIGEKLGCGGYLNDLKRTRIILTQTYADFTQTNADSKNVFTIEQALTFEDMENNFLEFYAKVYGRVQGVGYRYFVKEKAQSLDICGYVKNLEDGTVEVLAQGREENLQKLIEELKKGPFLARVDKLDIVFRKPLNIFYNFLIEH